MPRQSLPFTADGNARSDTVNRLPGHKSFIIDTGAEIVPRVRINGGIARQANPGLRETAG